MILLLIARVLYSFQSLLFFQKYLSTIVAALFLYIPVLVLWKQSRKIDFLDSGWRNCFYSLGWALLAVVVVFPPYFVLAHFWMKWVWGLSNFVLAPFPFSLDLIGYQLILVALPEEFFFRGYLQSLLSRVFPARWNVLGIRIGWGFWITAGGFAFGHRVIFLQWWHFSIFFPALLFGYLRERTGSITAPILLHAFSNLFIDWFTRCYF